MRVQKEYLEKHQYSAWQNQNDGRWYTHLPDESKPKGRRLISRSTKEQLEQEIVKFYKAQEERGITLRDWYGRWLDYKQLQTNSMMYIKRIDADWVRYYREDSIVDTPIKDLTYDILQEWALRKIKINQLTKKQYYNMTIIMRQSLDYAVQKGLIEINQFAKVRVDGKLFKGQKKPDDATQVYLTSEQPEIEAEAWADFEKTGESACLATPFILQTGLRLGEVVALKESDVQGCYLHVQRMETRVVETSGDGVWHEKGYAVVDHAKTDAGDREVYLSKTAQEIIERVMVANREKGYADDGYLFLSHAGRIHETYVRCRIKKYCRHIGLKMKGAHKMRKTYISALIDGGVNINEIRKQVGHADERTTYKNYCFNRRTRTETENLIEKALG